jgi:hypothetical protein
MRVHKPAVAREISLRGPNVRRRPAPALRGPLRNSAMSRAPAAMAASWAHAPGVIPAKTARCVTPRAFKTVTVSVAISAQGARAYPSWRTDSRALQPMNAHRITARILCVVWEAIAACRRTGATTTMCAPRIPVLAPCASTRTTMHSVRPGTAMEWCTIRQNTVRWGRVRLGIRRWIAAPTRPVAKRRRAV